MNSTIFSELRFWLLIVFSFVLPVAIYGALLAKRAISRNTVLFFGLLLVTISGIDVYLLRSLATLAAHSLSLADDAVFASEVSIALYLLPAMFGGIGISVISHVLIRHLDAAEKRFGETHPDGTRVTRFFKVDKE